jgi:hypothetical protein
MRGGCCFIFGIGGIVDHHSLNSHFINLNKYFGSDFLKN